MKKTFIAALMGAAALTACTPVDVSEEAKGEESAEASNAALETVLAADYRAEDKARDQYRNPAETLAFFQVTPDQTVIEYAPGGGWYTRVLAPYVAEGGSYIAVSFDPDAIEAFDADTRTRVREGVSTFGTKRAEETGIDAAKMPAYVSSEIPAEVNGTVDRVIIPRMMHNLMRWGVADSEVEALKKALKPDGMIGIIQHRAKADAPADYVDGSKGYLKQADLVAFMEKHGFELVAESDVNANPNDTADYSKGVWTLPPSFAEGDVDREKYAEIGESDRMTLLFKIADADEETAEG